MQQAGGWLAAGHRVGGEGGEGEGCGGRDGMAVKGRGGSEEGEG